MACRAQRSDVFLQHSGFLHAFVHPAQHSRVQDMRAREARRAASRGWREVVYELCTSVGGLYPRTCSYQGYTCFEHSVCHFSMSSYCAGPDENGEGLLRYR